MEKGEEKRVLICLLAACVIPFLAAWPIFHFGRIAAGGYERDPLYLLVVMAVGFSPLWWIRTTWLVKVGLTAVHCFVMLIPVALFTASSTVDPSKHAATLQQVEWFGRETGLLFPAQTEYDLFFKEDSFVGSGGFCRLKIRMRSSKVQEFLQQPLLNSAVWDGSAVMPGQDFLPEWHPPEPSDHRSAEVRLVMKDSDRSMAVAIGYPVAGFTDVYLVYRY